MSDKAQILGRQIAAARALLGISQTELAELAHISVATLRRMESSNETASGLINNVNAVKYALESEGAIFLLEDEQGPGYKNKKRL